MVMLPKAVQHWYTYLLTELARTFEKVPRSRPAASAVSRI